MQAELPQNILRVDGRPSRIKRSQEQYTAIESKQGMIPWNGQQDNLIDRFDGRALLDFYREPDAQAKRARKTEDELELDEVSQPGSNVILCTLHAACFQGLCLQTRVK